MGDRYLYGNPSQLCQIAGGGLTRNSPNQATLLESAPAAAD